MAPNHGGDPLESILGSMGSHWVKEIGQNRKKLPCPKIRIFGYPAVILGPMGSHWVKKMGQNRKNYHAPKFEFLATPVIYFWQKIEVTVMAPNHGADTLGSILGPMGSKKWVKTGKNYHAPKFEFLVIDFSQKIEVTFMAPTHGGDPLGFILGPMGSHWVQKMGHRFFAKNRSYGHGAKSRWGPPRVHLGANGVPLGPKNGSKP